MTDPPTTSAHGAGPSGVTVRIATRDELADALAVQHDGFGRIARQFGIPLDVLPPTRETLEDLERLHDEGMRTFLAITEARVVGTVRSEVRDDGVVEIGRLAVAQGWLRRGIASALMVALEESYPEATRFELFTGAEALEPLALYRKLGYEVFREEAHERVVLVWLAKERGRPTVRPAPPLH